jgi:sulfate adenylyltransferase subunit 2
MIRFRDETAKRLGLGLIVNINQDGVDRGIGPVTHGSKLHTDVMKTQGFKQALNKHSFDAAFGGVRRQTNSRCWTNCPCIMYFSF